MSWIYNSRKKGSIFVHQIYGHCLPQEAKWKKMYIRPIWEPPRQTINLLKTTRVCLMCDSNGALCFTKAHACFTSYKRIKGNILLAMRARGKPRDQTHPANYHGIANYQRLILTLLPLVISENFHFSWAFCWVTLMLRIFI